MAKISSKKKENIIIYGSLVAAIICLIYAGVDYYRDLNDSVKVKDEIKEAFKEMTNNDTDNTKNAQVPEVEPSILQKTDKKAIIIDRLNDIKNRKSEDDMFTYKMIRSWGNYEILDITYQKEVIEDYFMYSVNIKIPNMDASIPDIKNEELSTDNYIVITFKTFIIKNNDKYSFKHFEK